MFDRQKYRNDVPYPQMSEHTTVFWYSKGKVVAQKKAAGPITSLAGEVMREVDLKHCLTERVLDTPSYDAARAAYNKREAEISAQFTDDLIKENGLENHPFKDAILSLAWDMGHSAGREEVWNHVGELSEKFAIPHNMIVITPTLCSIGNDVVYDTEIRTTAQRLEQLMKNRDQRQVEQAAKSARRNVKKKVKA